MTGKGFDVRTELASTLVDEVLKPFVPSLKGSPVTDHIERGEAFRDMIAALYEAAKERRMSPEWVLIGIAKALELTSLPWDEQVSP